MLNYCLFIVYNFVYICGDWCLWAGIMLSAGSAICIRLLHIILCTRIGFFLPEALEFWKMHVEFPPCQMMLEGSHAIVRHRGRVHAGKYCFASYGSLFFVLSLLAVNQNLNKCMWKLVKIKNGSSVTKCKKLDYIFGSK